VAAADFLTQHNDNVRTGANRADAGGLHARAHRITIVTFEPTGRRAMRC
jgi:hypothetical protein